MVGTEKLMFGVCGMTTATCGVSFLSSTVSFFSVVACGGKIIGSTTTGMISSSGGTGLMAIRPRRAPKMPISRKRMQTEFTHASFRFGVAVRRWQAKPRQFVFQLVAGRCSVCIHVILQVQSSEHIAQRTEEAEAFAVWRRVDADAGAVAQFITNCQ